MRYRLRAMRGHIDNLALADRYLAHMRRLLEQNNQWDSATVIVMGDHSWRTSSIWKDSMTWTDEDEAASHGGEFDPRPAYIVKLPTQKTPHVSTSFSPPSPPALCSKPSYKNISKLPPTSRPGPASKNSLYRDVRFVRSC